MKKPAPIRRSRPSEEGYILVAVICMVALLTIALAVALPKVSKEIQRDRELETMQRGKQYARGVRLYYKKFNAYPPNVDALIKPTNKIRFLRKKYADPTSGKEDWKPVRFGQNKAPTVMGFFGQPMGLSTIAGVGPPGAANNGLTPPTTPPTNPSAAPTDTSNPSPSGSTTGQPGSTTGLNGQTFGGGGIIGFSPNSPKQSILVYKKMNHYNEWEFVYDPISERMMQGGNKGTIGNPVSATTTPIGGTPGIGGNPGMSGTNPGGTVPTPPPTPPQ